MLWKPWCVPEGVRHQVELASASCDQGVEDLHRCELYVFAALEKCCSFSHSMGNDSTLRRQLSILPNLERCRSNVSAPCPASGQASCRVHNRHCPHERILRQKHDSGCAGADAGHDALIDIAALGFFSLATYSSVRKETPPKKFYTAYFQAASAMNAEGVSVEKTGTSSAWQK